MTQILESWLTSKFLSTGASELADSSQSATRDHLLTSGAESIEVPLSKGVRQEALVKFAAELGGLVGLGAAV
jgi:hypothetical protein